VWEALKILDAADAEHPEASSEVYGVLCNCNRLWVLMFSVQNWKLVPIFCVDF
jgi:hypothetical protein